MEKTASVFNIYLEISDHVEKLVPKPVIFYQIQVRCNEKNWIVERRYSEFDKLLNALKKVFSNIPMLPPKTAFKLKSPEGIWKRKQGLNTFLRALVEKPEVLNHDLVCNFLKLSENNPGVANAVPIKVAELSGLPMGVRDFVYMEDIGMLFLALSDMNIVSRVDAYFTNFKFPWDKKPDIQTVVGAVLGYQVNYTGEGPNKSWEFERIWAKTYGTQTNILVWASSLGLLAVGMDDGFVHGIKVTAESSYESHDDVFFYCPPQ